jgi:predicted enzyme related to lactoylglutathione lyase
MDIAFDDGVRNMARRKPDTAKAANGTMAFSELSSTDPAATRGFLEKVFGWRFESQKFPLGEYLSFQAPGGGRGGVRPVQAKEIPGSMNYVRVEDLDAASRRIERAGGAIVLPRVDIPGMGSFFWFRIPGGPILAAWQDAPALPEERDE